MSQAPNEPSKPSSSSRKRTHVSEFPFDEEEAIVWQAGAVTLEDPIRLFEGAPTAKRAKVMGRPPRPEVECEHGSVAKQCQKCLYRIRQSKMISAQDYRTVAARTMFLWSQNLVYFGTLALSIVMPHRDPPGYERACQVIDSRIAQFHLFAEQEHEAVKEKPEEFPTLVASALATIKLACPSSPQTTYMARWIINNYTGMRDLKSLVGEMCTSLTYGISDLWDDQMLCPGITDSLYVIHFQNWKGVAWVTKEGLQATRAQDDDLVRAYACTGFSDQPGQLCSKCHTVRRHLQKECSAYKKIAPSAKFLASILSPGYREVFDSLGDVITPPTTTTSPPPASSSPSSSAPSPRSSGT